ncbi:Histone acetyltransferase KAT6B [Mizuhopecten yessoensis]|uniref:Histone acetyltransferase KAT6B n=2 Tax=Mizuhopecten yessoensis TaxID=6573 RepID=A0A210QTE6_MIZYE|nr:Histone acetyltransferase KAT6B [Mizuhopecten yessoensis]
MEVQAKKDTDHFQNIDTNANTSTEKESEDTMTSVKDRDTILQIIDQLRMRKARPDLNRICHMALRRYGTKHLDTEVQLEKLVDLGIVVKVDYKSNVSYRNATKWKKKPFGRKLLNSNSTNKNIRTAIKALLELGSEDVGASAKDIEKWLLAETESRLTKNQLLIAIGRDVDNGGLKKLSNGNYALNSGGENKSKTVARKKQQVATGRVATATSSKPDKPEKTEAAATTVTSPKFKRGRPPSKRKKFRKTHGPDFETQSHKKKNSSDDEEASICDYCLKATSSASFSEGLLTCKECKATAHPSCMGYCESLARRALESPWQCIDCKTCFVCEDSGDPEMMLFCDSCDKGYHMNCHNPPLEKKPLGNWVCSKCVLEKTMETSSDGEDLQDSSVMDDSQVTDGGGASCLPTPCDSPASEEEEEEEKVEPLPRKRKTAEGRKKSLDVDGKKGDKMDKVIIAIENGLYPDASKWKVEDVVHFFVNVGFKEQAEALKEQEIDGQSLLLMKRSDVLTGLSIKLGPALKMYQHVMKLQTSGFDFEES